MLPGLEPAQSARHQSTRKHPKKLHKENFGLPKPRLLGLPEKTQCLIPAEKTGKVLHYPRLENVKWTST